MRNVFPSFLQYAKWHHSTQNESNVPSKWLDNLVKSWWEEKRKSKGNSAPQLGAVHLLEWKSKLKLAPAKKLWDQMRTGTCTRWLNATEEVSGVKKDEKKLGCGRSGKWKATANKTYWGPESCGQGTLL